MKPNRKTDNYPGRTDAEVFRRVVHIGPSLHREGGITSVMKSYRAMLPSFRHIATNSRLGPTGSAVRMAALIVRLPVLRLLGKTDILHIQGGSGKSWLRKSLIIKWGSALGFKVVYHSHGGLMAEYSLRYGRGRMAKVLRRCSAVVVLSDYWRRFFTSELNLPRVEIINNVVEAPASTDLHTYPDDMASDSSSASLRLLFLGSINEKKGIFDLVETIAANASRWRGKLSLAIGGDGPAMDQLRESVDHLGVGDMVTFHGWVSGDAKNALLRHSDAIVLPSYIEGMPVCILEGMARAMPAIASNVGGIPEIVENGVNGFIFGPGDRKALADAIDAYIANPALIAAHGTASLRRAAPFLPDAVRSSLAKLYRTL